MLCNGKMLSKQHHTLSLSIVRIWRVQRLGEEEHECESHIAILLTDRRTIVIDSDPFIIDAHQPVRIFYTGLDLGNIA